VGFSGWNDGGRTGDWRVSGGRRVTGRVGRCSFGLGGRGRRRVVER